MKNRNLNDFDNIYRMYFKDVYRFIYSLVQHPEEAHDITQDIFVKLYRFLESGRTLLNPKAWIYRTAINTSFSLLKRKKRYKEIIERNFRDQVSTGDVASEVMKQQEIALLRRSISLLPGRDRIILTLYKNGLSTGEIAEIIKVKVGSVGKILARSVEKLSRLINKGGAR